MNVLITGGTGFLGRHAAVRLRESGASVAILGRNDAIGRELTRWGIEYRKADLADEQRVVEACRGRDAVIHCGGLASPWGKYSDFYSANVLGTRHILRGCKTHAVGRLVHVSTPSLYFDYRDRTAIRESDPLPRPATHYARTKGMADAEVERAFRDGLPSLSIRPRALFGPGDQAVLVRVLRAAEKGSLPLVRGGEALVDLTYIGNAVDALIACLSAPEAALGRCFNITNGEPMRLRDVLGMLFSALGTAPRFRPVPFPVAYGVAAAMELGYAVFRPGHEPPLSRYSVGLMGRSQTLDISAARADLGYVPRVGLREGMVDFASWWQDRDRPVSFARKLGLSEPAALPK
jgi:nucleoside-diphosphate-sugar epimerase